MSLPPWLTDDQLPKRHVQIVKFMWREVNRM